MITIQTPAKVSLCGNAVKIKLTTNNHLDQPGELAVSQLIFSQALANDETVTFEFAGKEIVFTCKTSPDDSGLQFRDNGESLPLADWIDYPYQAFLSNYHLTTAYKLQKESDRIIFTSYLKHENYTLDITAPGAKTSIDQQEGETPVLKDFFLLHSQIILGSISDPEQYKKPDGITPTLDGEAIFDISDLFKADFQSAFAHPQAGTRLIRREGMVKRYDISYFQSSGTEFEPGKISYAQGFYTLMGGVSDKKLQQYQDAGSDFWTDLQSTKRFLTTQPLNKMVSTNQPERLYFLNYLDLSSFTLKLLVKVYFDDETDQVHELDQLSSSRFEVIEAMVGYDVLDLGSLPKKVIRYQVWLENADAPGTAVSEVRTFSVDYTPYQNTRYIVFRNSLGGYDTLRCTGNFSREVETKRNIMARHLSDDLRNTYEYFSRRSHKVDIFQGDVGWTSKKYFRYLEDFFLSDQVFLITGDDYLRLVLRTDSSQFDWDDPNPGSLQFEALSGLPDFFFQMSS